MSKILVVAINERCPAAFALRSEQLPFELVLAEDEFTYGQTLQRYWLQGEDFVNIEHDVIPWPGAITQLIECDCFPWCGFDHPIGESGLIQGSIGCVKFSGDYMKENSDAVKYWNEIAWNQLDAAVFYAMGGQRWHKHTPPVAHIDAMKEF